MADKSVIVLDALGQRLSPTTLGKAHQLLSSGQATYFSRSRNTLWVKGQTSGHVQWVKEIRIDCDADTILLKVQQVGGAACHTGFQSCFHRRVAEGSVEIIGQPVFDPKEVYHK